MNVWLRRVRESDAAELKALAQADAHEAFRPTHVFVRVTGVTANAPDGAESQEEIIGCASIASIPLLLPWFHTERCKARDSVQLINVMENLMAELMNPRQEFVCVPVAKDSPFEAVSGRLGYEDAGAFRLKFKKLK